MKDIFLLDADETILDFSRSEREAAARVFARHGVSPSEAVLARYHEINDSLWKALERGEITREKLLSERFALLFEELGVTADVGSVSAEYFSELSACGHLLEGAETFLKKLSRRGRIYIVTNGSAAVQRRRLADTGADAFADGVFISQEMGVYKPAREYARYVEEHIPDYARERAVWIGDSLTSDMVCAESAGIDFILYAPQGETEGCAHPVARSYDEIFAVLEEM